MLTLNMDLATGNITRDFIGFLYNDILSVAVYDRCCTVATYDKITYKTLKNKII